jgi:hypothetical protein
VADENEVIDGRDGCSIAATRQTDVGTGSPGWMGARSGSTVALVVLGISLARKKTRGVDLLSVQHDKETADSTLALSLPPRLNCDAFSALSAYN